MCATVLTADGQVLECVADIRAYGIPVEDEDFDVPGVPAEAAARYCLCCADVDAILVKAGVRYSWDPAFDYELLDPRLPSGGARSS